MLLEWHPGMSIGVALIDDEHRKLIGYLNALSEAIELDHADDAMLRLLDETIAYSAHHFKHEEELFLQTPYPKKEAHLLLHQKITDNLAAIHHDFVHRKHTVPSIKFMLSLKEWLIEHIQCDDREYVPYLNSADRS